MLEPAGFGDRVAEANRTAVRLAQEARDAAAERPVAVAGSICEWVFDRESRFVEPAAQAAALHEQAELLAEAGVELIALEMCLDPPESALAAEAALATGLPVWAGMSCGRYPEAPRLQVFRGATRGGGDFESLVETLAGYPLGAMTVMHSPLPDTVEGLEVVRRHWQGPLGAYPEAGYFIMPNWQFQAVSDEELLGAARDWLAQGTRIVGGCCGLGPRHIAVLRDGLGL
jgi:homocysteine S-methyltransferase